MSNGSRDIVKDAIVEAGKTTTVHFSIFRGGHIRGTIVNEQNRAKIQNAQLTLTDDSGKKLATTVTDMSGTYAFENLEPGKYKVICNLPVGYRSNGPLEKTFEIKSEETAIADFVMFKYGVIEGTIINEYSKTPVKNIRVELLDTSGRVLTSAITDDKGYYMFPNIESNRYSIRMVMPSEYRTKVK